MSAFGAKADIILGKADIAKCPLMTQSGHRPIIGTRCEINQRGKLVLCQIGKTR